MFESPSVKRNLLKGRKLLCISMVAMLVLFVLARAGYNQNRENDYMETQGVDGNKVKRLPEAVIVGCRKSGTRALMKFLQVNKAVKGAQKEVHFFDDDRNYMLGLEWYKEQMPRTEPGELTIEKSPAYFNTRNVPERIHEMNSSIKIIVIFRNPVTRLISDFSQLVANRIDVNENTSKLDGDDEDDVLHSDSAESDEYGRQSGSSANSSAEENSIWLRAEQEFEDHVLRPDGGINDQWRAIKLGMYSIYLERWLAIFPRSQMHFVDGERLIIEPHVELQKLETFLGVPRFIRQDHFVFNNKKGFFCLNATALGGSAHSTSGGRRREDDRNWQPHCLSRSKGRRHVRVRRDLLTKLDEFYQPFNEYLYLLTGINLTRVG